VAEGGGKEEKRGEAVWAGLFSCLERESATLGEKFPCFAEKFPAFRENFPAFQHFLLCFGERTEYMKNSFRQND